MEHQSLTIAQYCQAIQRALIDKDLGLASGIVNIVGFYGSAFAEQTFQRYKSQIHL